MIRKLTTLFLCAFAALFFSSSIATAQQQTQLPKQNPFRTLTKSPTATAEARTRANAATNGADHDGGAVLPTFDYTVTSTRDGNTYSGTIVGRSPFTDRFGFVAIPSQLIPIVVVTNSVFAGVNSSGQVVTAPGVTVFDPTVADDSCLTPPNDVPLNLVRQSPIYEPADFNYGGTDVGFTQATDAFQRANFFKLIAPFGDGDFSTYHVLLAPVRTTGKFIINVPAASGVAFPSAAFGGCPTGQVAIIDVNFYEPAIEALFPALASQGVNAGSFPFFSLHNVVECEGTGCATLNTGLCCILGFHDIFGSQTFGTATFDTSEIFVSPIPDITPMSHEVAEWMNDPNTVNPTPAWGHVGQVAGCQNNLEVGDPLSGTMAPRIFMRSNGFTYHLQELAFFSWFYGAPSVGVNGWFSNNGTFLSDAGPVCM
ncbi:MAG: hypothetical protein WB780_15475 [Candidatus Acidiferrales bacterium]